VSILENIRNPQPRQRALPPEPDVKVCELPLPEPELNGIDAPIATHLQRE